MWTVRSWSICILEWGPHKVILITSVQGNWPMVSNLQYTLNKIHIRVFILIQWIWISTKIISAAFSGMFSAATPYHFSQNLNLGTGYFKFDNSCIKRVGGKRKILITAFSMFILFPLKTEVHPLCYIRWLNPNLKVHLNHKSRAIQCVLLKWGWELGSQLDG